MKKHYVKVDSRNRVSLTKILKNLPDLFRAYTQGDKIILEPIRDIPEAEQWLFDPKNKDLLQEVKKGLQQEADIDLGSFAEYLED